MKYFLLGLLVSGKIWACSGVSPAIYVAPLIFNPGGQPSYEDGTLRYPFRSLSRATAWSEARRFCTTRVLMQNGHHTIGKFVVSNSLEITGSDRFQTVIHGGFYVGNQASLKLQKLSFNTNAPRIISVDQGQLKTLEITIQKYQFTNSDPSYPYPAAIEIKNSIANLSGLDVLEGNQPIMQISGARTRAKMNFFTVKNTTVTPYVDQLSSPTQHGAVVEVNDSALANFFLADFKNIEFSAILVQNKARLFAAQLAINYVKKPAMKIKSSMNGVFGYNAKAIQLNGFRVQQSLQAGVMAVESFVTLQKGISAYNMYGFVDRNSSAVNGVNGYDTHTCVTTLEMSYENNETDYLTNGDLPVPNSPLPVACPSGCQTTAPAPTQEKPPVICPTVEII